MVPKFTTRIRNVIREFAANHQFPLPRPIGQAKVLTVDGMAMISTQVAIHPVVLFRAIRKGSRAKLCFPDGSLTSWCYLRMLEGERIISSTDAQYGKGGHIFQQNGAPAHMSRDRLFIILHGGASLNPFLRHGQHEVCLVLPNPADIRLIDSPVIGLDIPSDLPIFPEIGWEYLMPRKIGFFGNFTSDTPRDEEEFSWVFQIARLSNCAAVLWLEYTRAR
jgi:hypothetical protein